MPLSLGTAVTSNAFAAIRRRMALDFCKWDPQVEDVAALARTPLCLQPDTWNQLSRWAEQLYDETLAAEQELLRRPELIGRLGLPRAIRRLIKRATASPPSPSVARVMRFDFHWTTEGWRISEVNSDVPGGFIEASPFTNLMAESTGGVACGDPAAAYIEQLAESIAGTIGFVHATAYSDDRQVMTYLARLWSERGRTAHLVSPADVEWRDGQPMLVLPDGRIPARALVRFFPGEWLPDLGRRAKWARYFFGSQSPLSNPAWALLSQSKRWPLVWNELATPLPCWRELLPDTRDPRDVAWRTDPRWVIKPALGRVGDSIGVRGVTGDKDWKFIASGVRWRPTDWIAQRRFESVAVESPSGPAHAVIGVYVIAGRVAGVYGRLAQRPLIDHLAQDVAVLLAEPRGVVAPRIDELRLEAGV